jgi:hypothetical protein
MVGARDDVAGHIEHINAQDLFTFILIVYEQRDVSNEDEHLSA